jgi:hypothetical protein
MSISLKPPAPGVPSVIEYLLKTELSRVTSGQAPFFSIDSRWKSIIGQQGIKEIASKLGYECEFSSATRAFNKELRTHLNSAIRINIRDDRVVMVPVEGSVVVPTVVKKKAVKGTKDERIPRPPNAFILYRQHYHPLVKRAHPEFHNNQICKFLFITFLFF